MKKHGQHDHIHAVPVGISAYFQYPLPEVQIKPDPDADTKDSKGDYDGEHIDDEKDVLEILNLCIETVHIIIS